MNDRTKLSDEERKKIIHGVSYNKCEEFGPKEWREISNNFDFDILESILYYCGQNGYSEFVDGVPESFMLNDWHWDRLLDSLHRGWWYSNYGETNNYLYRDRDMEGFFALSIRAKNDLLEDRYVNTQGGECAVQESVGPNIEEENQTSEWEQKLAEKVKECEELRSSLENAQKEIVYWKEEAKKKREQEDEWYKEEYYCRFIAEILRDIAGRTNGEEKKVFKQVLLDITAEKNYIPDYMKNDIKILANKNYKLSLKTQNYGTRAIHSLCPAGDIIEFVKKIKNEVAEPWVDKWGALWEGITEDERLGEILGNKGKQQNTTFNKYFVCQIIKILQDNEIVKREASPTSLSELLDKEGSSLKAQFTEIKFGEVNELKERIKRIIKELKTNG